MAATTHARNAERPCVKPAMVMCPHLCARNARQKVHEYENTRRVVYENGATFVPVCETCHRFVTKTDDVIYASEAGGLSKRHNATCVKCGRTHMVFEGFLDYGN